MFDVAVILINYNSSAHTLQCVQSVLQKTAPGLSYQIIVTDNNSGYEDYLLLKSGLEALALPNVQLHRSRINTGFGGGNMFGVQYANATYLAFLNNDTVLKNDCLSILKTALEENPHMGIAGAQAFKEDGSFMVSLDHFASPAREIFGRSLLENINPKRYPKRKKQYTNPVKINFVPGSFMFVRAADFYAVGGFDNNIFLYYEETDLCKRLKANGKDAYLVPAAEFIHYHGVSTGKSEGIKKELKISLLYVLRKHYGNSGWFSVWLFLLLKYMVSGLIKPKNWPYLVLLLKGAPLSASLKQKQAIAEK
ncbi:glycosyltransferase family 2 protein [Flavobacterium sp. RHBU_24]|uniref:glycosyltransferase family 2 protein n=1 Tax=Flavobacterium sp. RHBU_24 TaxID=3391185 RepID=UPI003984CDB1